MDTSNKNIVPSNVINIIIVFVHSWHVVRLPNRLRLRLTPLHDLLR